MPRRSPAALAVAVLCAACTSSPPGAAPTPPSSSAPSVVSVSPTPSATPVPVPPFDGAKAAAHARHLAMRIGPREAGSKAYVEAADYVAGVLAKLGYAVQRQRVPLPPGTSVGVAVPAGETQNVVAEPPGFDPAAPHVLVGAHLDTVANSPGANDNGSGIGTLLELARLALLRRPSLTTIFVVFGGEERRRPGITGATFGSRHYLAGMGSARRAGLRRVLVVDMVGNGSRVNVCHGGKTPRAFVRATLDVAARLKIPAREQVVTRFYSDHKPFEDAGYTVAWLWSGDHATVHTVRDNSSVLQEAEIGRIGAVAWGTLRTIVL